MTQKKICMMGAFAVGKTSLVSRIVTGIFPDKYLTTVGVKIDRALLQVTNRAIQLILWDLHGEDEFQKVRMSYLRGSAGYILVADLTRRSTLEKAIQLQREAQETLGSIPFVLAVNKSDLIAIREIQDEDIRLLVSQGWTVLLTSAKSNSGVQEAFSILAERILEGQ
jgi:small GTP-binding protein